MIVKDKRKVLGELKVNKQYSRGLRHGRLNIYNPAVLFGQDFKDYMAGYRRGRLGYYE
jgi:hypothetical protein